MSSSRPLFPRALDPVLIRVLAVVAVACASATTSACAAPSQADRIAASLAGHPQARPLTCESRSAADLLAFHRRPGTEADVFARIARSDDPDTGFVGDADGPPGRLPPDGYGVHAGPIAAALVDLGLDATAVRGRGYAWLEAETRAHRPVIVWITASCDPSMRTPMVDAKGRSFTAVRGEHTVLVVSADDTGVTVIDPAGGYRRRFERDEFQRSWSLFDEMAVSAGASGAGPASADAPDAPRVRDGGSR